MAAGNPDTRKNLIIDTDIFSDVDDAGALLVAATSQNAKLLGVNVNHQSKYSCLTASAILAHYGLAEVPIGARRPLTDDIHVDEMGYGVGEFTSQIAQEFDGGSLRWGHAEDAWEPVSLYRRILADADDSSITIASIGFLGNLSGLLSSKADQYSDLSGEQLVTRKVAELVVMGGAYPSGREFNFYGDGPSSTIHVVNTWPTAITFLGSEVGYDVLTGVPLLTDGPENDPVRQAYKYYTYGKPRMSWDPLTVFYAIHGLADLFEYNSEPGYNQVHDDGSNEWMPGVSEKKHRYLKLKVETSTAAATLDQLFLDGARQWEGKQVQ